MGALRWKRLGRYIWPTVAAIVITCVVFLLANLRGTWYQSLHKPAFYPPDGWIYAAWGVMAACATISCVWAAHCMHRASRRDDGTILSYLLFGLLHALWALTVFTLQAAAFGVFVMFAACAAAALLTRRVARLYRFAAIPMIPVLLVCAAMLALNYAVAMIN